MPSIYPSLRPRLPVRGVGLIGVDVHGEGRVRVHVDEHVAKAELAVPGHTHAHDRLVARTPYLSAFSGVI